MSRSGVSNLGWLWVTFRPHSSSKSREHFVYIDKLQYFKKSPRTDSPRTEKGKTKCNWISKINSQYIFYNSTEVPHLFFLNQCNSPSFKENGSFPIIPWLINSLCALCYPLDFGPISFLVCCAVSMVFSSWISIPIPPLF